MNYKEAYFQLAGAIANAIECLTNAQIETEKVIINQKELEKIEDGVIKFTPKE